MSIEMENPETLLEKSEAAGNLVQQMFLAHETKNTSHFKETHKKATALLFDLCSKLEEIEDTES